MTEALNANLITKSEHETINSFFDKIHRATMEQSEWVETSEEIIKHYNKQGLGKQEYFIFQGIKVCKHGNSKRIQKDMSRQVGEIIYGEEEGKVNQGSTTKKVTT